jgi:hypothetical protein
VVGEGSYFLLLEEDGPLKKALTPAGLIGWICVTGEYIFAFEEVINGQVKSSSSLIPLNVP